MNVESIFRAALEKTTPHERAAFLDDVCAGEPEIRAAVEALLAGTPTDAPVDGDETLAAVEPTALETLAPTPRAAEIPHVLSRPGLVIADRYTLRERIGEGGMGEIWIAAQSRPVKRDVALKLIKPGMDSRAVLARFEQERQALALMDHPNIAGVLDGGLTPDGRPFFAMELVRGPNLTKYCDDARLTPRERLELFVPICRAVQHAHQKGIVHRDLKPANILVAVVDGRPVPKVIDFGVAKAVAGKITDESLSTQFGAVVGTLEYMSPEQAGFSGEDVDTRSDVYSLGVVLYELLTGLRPIDAGRLKKAAFSEMIRIIREEEPSRPSTRLSTDESLPSLAALRRSEPRELMALLRGELDWIVMRCLEKHRDRRYETADGLARDILRHLADEPVEAKPPSTAYRLSKFLRRNRGAVAAAAAVAASLLIGLIAFARQAEIAREQRDLAFVAQRAESAQRIAADAQRDRAVRAEAETKRRADELELVADFLAKMLDQVDPTEAGAMLTNDVAAKFAAAPTKAGVPADGGARDRRIKEFADLWSKINATDVARELVDGAILKPAVKAVDAQFKTQPLVDARLRQALADRYVDLSLYDEAAPLQAAALAIRRRELGDEHPDTLKSMNSMGLLLDYRGESAQAESYLREALETRRRVLGPDDPKTLESLNNVGNLLLNQNKPADAERYFREALDKCRRVLGEDDVQTINEIGALGVSLHNQRKLTGAEPYLREAVEKRRRVLGPDDPSTLVSVGNLGNLLRDAGKLAEAEPFLREAAEKRRRVLGEDHINTLNSINNLAVLLRTQGKFAEAEVQFREVVGKLGRVVGDDHPGVIASIGSLGEVLRSQNKLAEAEPYLRESLEKRRRILGPDHRSTLIAVGAMGGLLRAQGKFAEAITLLEPAEPKFRVVFKGADAVQLASSLSNLGQARAGLKRFAEAESALTESYTLMAAARGGNHDETLAVARALFDLHTARHAAEPDKGHDARAAEWKAKLEAAAKAK